jgi:hypothetical protein
MKINEEKHKYTAPWALNWQYHKRVNEINSSSGQEADTLGSGSMHIMEE